MENAIVMNIQKFSVHDGPGIRTTVFLKGCPLRCWWCHNPESMNPNIEMLYFEDRCVGCGDCVRYCKHGARSIEDGKMILDRDKCEVCTECTDVCLNDALEAVGEEKTSREVMREILKDVVFYEESGGGVTFSGGEPFLHTEFLMDILPMCNERKIQTAIDTSGYTPWENIEKTLEYTDLYLYDLKHMDDEEHKKYTGVSNKLILENLEKLSLAGARVFVRMPIIKGVNDNMDHIEKAIEFIKKLNIEQVNLLPYHKMGIEKYGRLGKEAKLNGDEVPSDEDMNKFEAKFKENGIKVKIGG